MSARQAKTSARPPAKSTASALPSPDELQMIYWPAEILKTPAAPITSFTPELRAIALAMLQLMQEHKGVGLAGPQVGLPLRIFVMSETGKAADGRVAINPVLTLDGPTEQAEEGCLSIPEVRANIERHTIAHLQAMDFNGRMQQIELTGFAARIAQHESDHLDGILILDRMSGLAKLANRPALLELRAAADQAAKRKSR